MTAATMQPRLDGMPTGSSFELSAGSSMAARHSLAARDVADGLSRFRLACVLGWLDIRLRYRGSLLGPFWLTLSTAIMVASLGWLYAALFKMDIREYLPFIAVSLVLWNSFLAQIVSEACACFTQSEAMIRSMRMPYTIHALRTVVRNLLVLAHNIIVVIVVFMIFRVWPGWHALVALPGFVLWMIDGIAACLLLGAVCARFRDIAPIVGSVMQIAFFLTPIIWKPELVGNKAVYLPLNPFFSLLEVVRQPLLGGLPSAVIGASALGYSLLLMALAWLAFMHARARVAFWV
jgi:lipopolysaccharide transport system permease protein